MPEKEQVKVIVYTSVGKIKGTIYKLSGGRLLDAVNFAQKDFVAFTDIELVDPLTDKVIDKAPFLAIQRKNIIGIREDV